MMRMPVFVWMMLVVAFLTLFAMPPLTAALIQVYIDRNFHTNFFNAAAGGDPLLYQNLFWIFGHPEVYILILPGMGIVSEILPVFSRKPLFGYSRRRVLRHRDRVPRLGRVGAPHVRDGHRPGRDLRVRRRRRCSSRIPTGVKIFNWLGTVWGGAVRLATPMLFALGFIAHVHARRAVGRACTRSCRPTRSRPTPTSSSRTSTTCCSAASCSRSSAASTTGGRRSFGTHARREAGQAELLADARRLQPHVLPDALPRPRGHAPPHVHVRAAAWAGTRSNMLATIGAFIIALSVLVFLVNVVCHQDARRARRRKTRGTRARSSGRRRRRRPSTTSPRSRSSTHRDEFWHRKYTEDDEGRLVKLPPARPRRSRPRRDPHEPHNIHMPSPSYWPFVFALGLPILGYGFVFKFWWMLAVGALDPAVRPAGVGDRSRASEEAH